MTTIIFIGGVLALAFAIFHIFFWKVFGWTSGLASLNRVNRGLMHVLNLCITFVLFYVAFLSLFNTEDLVSTRLGHTVLVGVSLFCILRAVEQIIFFGLKHTVSIVFFGLFLLGSAIFAIPVFF